MCGIIGLFPYKFEDDSLNPVAKALVQRFLFAESLVFMESRGKDSTGIALLWDDHETAVVKQPVEASLFAKDDGLWGEDYTNPNDKDANFRWLMQTWLRKSPEIQLRQALGHVRAGTKGSEYNPHNNHPVIVSTDKFDKGGELKGELTIGVHNGTIRNDNAMEIKHGFKRVGEVDSEIIFQMIHKYRNDYTIENLQETFSDLVGAFAVLAFNPVNPNKVACMRETRPLNAAFIPEIGTLVLISERKYLDTALEEYERWRIREGDTNYTYVNDRSEKQDVGNIYESFPPLTVDWYDTTIKDTLESGVFVLDLDKETNVNTKVKDLIEVKSIFKPASAKITSTYRSNGTTIALTDKRSTTPDDKKDISITPITEDNSSNIEDLTEYALAVPTKSGEAEDTERDNISTDGQMIEVEVIGENEEEETEYDECPYTWDERIKMSMDSLYSAEEHLGDKLTLSRINEDNIQELLNKYLIKTKDPGEASTILASFYDIIFPEGFAVGFADGYETSTSDAEIVPEDEGVLEDNLHRTITGLENAVKTKDTAIISMAGELARFKRKQQRAGKYIATMRPLLQYFLQKEGILDEKGKVNQARLEVIKQEVGSPSDTGFTPAITQRVISYCS